MSMTIEVESLIPAYVEALVAGSEFANQQIALRVAGLAQDFVPKDTGSLHDTIVVEKDPDYPQGWVVLAGNIEGGYKGGSVVNDKQAGEPVDYAEDVEYGTRFQSAQPFMTPAAEEATPMANQFYEQLLRGVGGV